MSRPMMWTCAVAALSACEESQSPVRLGELGDEIVLSASTVFSPAAVGASTVRAAIEIEVSYDGRCAPLEELYTGQVNGIPLVLSPGGKHGDFCDLPVLSASVDLGVGSGEPLSIVLSDGDSTIEATFAERQLAAPRPDLVSHDSWQFEVGDVATFEWTQPSDVDELFTIRVLDARQGSQGRLVIELYGRRAAGQRIQFELPNAHPWDPVQPFTGDVLLEIAPAANGVDATECEGAVFCTHWQQYRYLQPATIVR